jgi:uncharacterized cupin superfamily protein
MRKGILAGLALALALGTGLAAQTGDKKSDAEAYVGTWTGTWDGAGSGKFDVIFEKGEGAAVTGRVEVTTDNGDYKAKFKSLAFDKNKMTASYDFPLDERAEVAVTATFEAAAAKGTWALRAKGEDGELAAGTWTVTRK